MKPIIASIVHADFDNNTWRVVYDLEQEGGDFNSIEVYVPFPDKKMSREELLDYINKGIERLPAPVTDPELVELYKSVVHEDVEDEEVTLDDLKRRKLRNVAAAARGVIPDIFDMYTAYVTRKEGTDEEKEALVFSAEALRERVRFIGSQIKRIFDAVSKADTEEALEAVDIAITVVIPTDVEREAMNNTCTLLLNRT